MKNTYLRKYVSSRGYFAKSFLKLTAICLLVFSGNIAWGQVATNYNFSQSNGTYTPITGGTVLGTASAASGAGAFDSQVWSIPNGSIPFAFNFNGNSYSGLNVNSNGYVTFGATAPSAFTSTGISSSTGYDGAIAAWSRDLNAVFAGGLIGEVRWEVVGTAPSREMVIQFKDWRPAFSTSATDVAFANFQIRLAETTSAIKVVYGAFGIAAGTPTSATTVQVGLRGTSNTDYNNRTNPTTAAFSASTAGASNSASQNFSYVAGSTSGLPASGLTYNWSYVSCITPSALTATAITPTSTTLTWSAPWVAPASGYEYEVRTSGAAGSGATGLVEAGSTMAGVTSKVVNGLISGTAYSVYVRSSCGSGSFSSWTSASTFTTGCKVPTAVSLSALTPTNATLTWSASQSSPSSGYQYEVRTSGAAGSGATGLVYSGTTGAGVLTDNISSLSPGTAYTIYVRSNCGSGDFSGWTAAYNFSTPCAAVGIPYVQNFESVTTPALPTCTSIQNAGTGNNWNTSSGDLSGLTGKYLRYSYNSTNAANAWFYTQGVNLVAGTSYRISYNYAGSNSYPEKLKVAYGTSPLATSMTTVINDHPNATDGPLSAETDFTPSVSGIYYFGFNAYSIANQNFLLVDNISVTLSPTCFVPTGLTSNSTTTTTSTILWTAPTPVPAGGYIYEIRTSGAAGSGATGLVQTGSTAAGVVTANITSLSPATVYNVYVRSYCGVGDSSVWTGANSLTTLCSPVSIPTVSQSFETTGLPICWSASVVSGTNPWVPMASNDGVPSGHSSAKFLGKLYNNSEALAFSQPINFSSASATGSRMRVWVYRNSSNDATDLMRFYVNNSQSLTGATQLLQINPKITVAPTVAASGWYEYVVVIPAAFDVSTEGYIIAQGITTAGGAAYGLGFDDMLVEPIPSCAEPTVLLATVTTSSTGTISWTAPAVAPAGGYEYEVRTSGAAGSGATGLATSGTTAAGVVTKNITGLTANTNYSVYVRSNCGSGSFSPWVGPSTMYTGYCSPAPSSVDGSGIINVAVGSINNPSLAETNNYGDYSAMSTDLVIGAPDTVRITYSTGFGYTYGTKIWIDFNDDLDFADAGELIYTGLSTALVPTTLKANIMIPVGATQGMHRMRIGGTDTDSGPSSPCYNSTYGTFEDYTVNIVCPATIPAPTSPVGKIVCATETAVLSITGVTGAMLTWYDAATAGAVVVANNDSLTTGVLATTTSYWVEQAFTGCAGVSSRVMVTATVAPVNLALTPINNTCNGYAAGSFALGTVICGTAPFEYSVNSGTFGPIPTNLAAGTYSVVVRDVALGLSQPISVVIGQPAAVIATPTVVADGVCAGATSNIVTALSPVLMPVAAPVVISFGLDAQPTETNAAPGTVITSATMAALPAGAVVTSVVLSMPNTVSVGGSWQSEIRLGASGAVANAAAAGTGSANAAGAYNYTRTLPNNSVNIAGGTVNLLYWNSSDDELAADATFATGAGVATITIQYSVPDPAAVTWWTAPTGGSLLGSTSTLETVGTSVLASPAAAGTYTFYAQTETGTCSSVTRSPLVVTVHALPTPTIVASNPILCAGSSIMLVSSSLTGNVWSTTGTNDTITVSNAGSFTVTVTDANGCVGTSAPYVTTITALPVVLAGVNQTVCENSNVTLNASGAPTLVWNNGVTNNVAFTATETEDYIVTGTAANGCVNTDTVTVNVNMNPVPVISGDLSFCFGDSTLLVASSETGNVWSTTQANDSIFVDAAGSYTVTETDANGCIGTSAPVVVSINALPTINGGSDIAVCQNGQAILFASGAQTYAWTGNITNGVSFVATATTTYTVTGTDANGCMNTDAVVVTVNPLPTVEAGMNQTLCGAGQVTLTATGAAVYSWNNGVVNGTAFTAPVGTNVYIVTGIDALGCSNTDAVTVSVNALPVATATAANQLTIVASPAGMSYQWMNCTTNAPILGANNQTFTAEVNGSYKVIVTGMGGCADTSACVNITSVGLDEKTADLGITLYPNPTEGNVYVNMTSTEQANIIVYDAQGKVVSEMSNIQNGTIIDLNNVENGMYMIQVSNPTGSNIFRIVKN